MQCPICATRFAATRVRSSALTTVRRESDMHTVYDGVNPLHYTVFVCPNCIYAAYDDDWDAVTDEERQRLVHDTEERRGVAAPYVFTGERDVPAATVSYLLALRCYDLRAPDPRRRANVQHRLAWAARETEDSALERQYIQHARREYETAFRQDDRLTDVGTLTISYLLGELALRLDNTHEALQGFERTRRMDQDRKHPEIARLIRDRWADARSMRDQQSA